MQAADSIIYVQKQESSKILNILKCMLCVGVVVIHSKLPYDLISNYPCYENFQFVFGRLIVGRVCVPFFFFISGYFFFTKCEKGVNRGYFAMKIRTRIKSILIPYLIANSIIIAYLLFRKKILGAEFPEGFNTFTDCFWGHPVNGLPIDMPLWYMKDLMIMAIISPIIYFLIKKCVIVSILLLIPLWYINFLIPFNIIHGNFESLLFFSLGALFSIKRIDIVNFFFNSKIGIPLIIVYLLCLLGAYVTREEFFAKTLSLMGIPVVIFLTSFIYLKMVNKNKSGGGILEISSLTTATFFVFMYHYYYPALLSKIVGTFVSNWSIELSLYFIFISSVLEKTLALLILYYVLRFFLPKMTSVIVGGR